MTIQHFASCPFCRRIFEHAYDAPVIMIDGYQRRACELCVPKPAPVKPVTIKTKGNGLSGIT